MAKFRTNHSRQGKGSSGGTVVRVGLFAAIVSGLFYIFNLFMGDSAQNNPPNVNQPKTEEPQNDDYDEGRYYLPTSTADQLIKHKYYALSYSEEHEQAEWVAYVLTRERLQKPWVQRVDNFIPDLAVKTGSATPDDFRRSGYDRGHLVPAADMAFSEEAMAETFFMSNISPQARNFNQGIWRELEELTRNWAQKFNKLYVVTGPVLSRAPKHRIGENKVSVPQSYFKVLLDLSEPELKGIAFILPNRVNYDPLYEYAVSIDEVEELTGINFFPDLMEKEQEEEIESNFNIDLWPFSKQKYDIRTEKWNKQ